MATADRFLRKELECPICQDEYSKPVTVGPCNHTFCKHCLQRHIDTKARYGEFPCPLCRQTCKLPPNGIDGLAPNFTVANIIEKYNEVRKQLDQLNHDLYHDQLTWNNCSHCFDSNTNVSSSLACLKCDGISLCYDCGLRHVNHPKTQSHVVIALCKLHGKPLSQFCVSCYKCICVVCFGKHSNIEDHDVVDYVDLVKGDKAELGLKARTAGTALRQLKKKEKQLKTLTTKREKDVAKARETTVAEFKAGEDNIDENYDKLRERFQLLRQQMEKTKQEMDDQANRKTNIQQIKKTYLKKGDKDFEAERNDITTTIQNVIDMQSQIEEGVNRSDALVSQKLLKAELHDDIVETRATLQELTDAAAIDRKTSFRERIRSDYGLSEEYIAAAGQFSSASQCSKFNVLECCYIWSVTYMSRNRIAASYRSTNDSYKVVQWKLPDETEHVLLQDTVLIPVVAYLGRNKLAVLRRASPILKFIDVVTKVTRDIDVDIPKEVIDKLWFVEVDDRGRFMVTFTGGDKLHHVLLINDEGKRLQELTVGYGYIPTFCRLTGMVTLSSAYTISCYQVNDDGLTKVMSAPHGVEGFVCYDIQSGSFGELFIVGVMKGDDPQEIRLYQLLLDTDKKTVSMKQIEITGQELRTNSIPTCSIHGNNLVISFDGTIKVLQLSA